MRGRSSLSLLTASVLIACFTACGTGPIELAARRVVATPEPTGHASVAVHVAAPVPKLDAARHSVVHARALAARPAAVLPPLADLSTFRGLGSWVDVFDYTNDPSTIVPLVQGMSAQGVRTAYLESARSTSAADVQFPAALGQALDAAKAKGLRAVAWYPPTFDDISRDIRRSIAAIRFTSPNGNHFDGFAADIEYTSGVPDAQERSKRAIAYSIAVRAAAPTAKLAAITIAPTSLEKNPKRWPNFPWAALGPRYDVFMPMNYWTAYGADTGTATRLTTANVQKEKQFTGKAVHIIGGLAENADPAQVTAYVEAARSSGSIGGGLYDFKTTSSNLWAPLRRLN